MCALKKKRSKKYKNNIKLLLWFIDYLLPLRPQTSNEFEILDVIKTLKVGSIF